MGFDGLAAGDNFISAPRRQTPAVTTSGPVALGQRLLAEGRPDAAIEALRSTLAQSTTVGVEHALCLDALLRTDRRREAHELLDAALALRVPSADAIDALAFYAARLERHGLAAELYRRATTLARSDGQIWYNLASAERSLGNLDAAVAACDEALRHEPGRYPALLLRSELRRATAASNHVDALKARVMREPDGPGRMFAAYALGKELHDLERYDEAFASFALGADLRRRSMRYDVAADEAKLARIRQAYDQVGYPIPADSGGGARHIFIIGLPRSGTTLTERILGSLAHVRSNGETENFSRSLLRGAASAGADVFERCARADDTVVAAEYDRLAGRGDGGTIIEKLPMNYLYAGAIARAMPDARLIWVRRHPVDSCFAMYRTLFGEAYPFTYSFGDLARYYAAFDRLMKHWQASLGERLFAVDYERLVADPAAVGEEVARHCGLQWEAGAVDITRNRTASTTASAAQVREPIYARSAGLWRKYERHLAPLVDLLRIQGVEVPKG